MQLFSEQSAKINKTLKAFPGYDYHIQYMQPVFSVERNTCPFSTDACRRTCLQSCGRLGWSNATRAKAARTTLYFENNSLYNAKMAVEIGEHLRQASKKGNALVLRLNGTSDIDFTNVWTNGQFSKVTFNEYTKNHKLATKFLNYHKRGKHLNVHFTLSYSGRNLKECTSYLKKGGNVAVVFEKFIPNTFNGFKVVNGDAHDFRFMDERGVVVGLIAKAPIGTKESKRAFIQNGIDGGFIIKQ